MNKLISLYKNKYIQLLVFIIFMIFLYRNHSGLEHLRNLDKQTKYNEQKFKIVKKIKTVLSDIKDGHGSYTKEITYEYVSDKEKEQRQSKESLSTKINSKIAEEISKNKEKKEEEKILKAKEQEKVKRTNSFIKNYKITKNKNTKNKGAFIKCGDTVEYKLATFINGKPMTLHALDSIFIVGAGSNKLLEPKFKGKQRNDVFEIDLNTLLGDNKNILQKAQKEATKGNEMQNNLTNTNYQLQSIDIKYRIKVIEITKGNTKIINKYCKK